MVIGSAGVTLLTVWTPFEAPVWVLVVGCVVSVRLEPSGAPEPGDFAPIERTTIDNSSSQVAPTSLVVATRFSTIMLTSVLSCRELVMPSRKRAAAV